MVNVNNTPLPKDSLIKGILTVFYSDVNKL